MALAYADQYPNSVKSLILIGSNPLFVASHDWPGMSPKAFNFFSKQCQRDIQKALTFFLTLQKSNIGLDSPSTLLAPPMPFDNHLTTAAAMNALMILAQSDLRQAYANLNMPTLSILGNLDQLVPMALRSALLRYSSGMQSINVFDNSAHAPFLDEEARFIQIMDDFLCKIY